MNVAVMGYGTVGVGVVEILRRHGDDIAQKVGQPLQVTKILVRHEYPGSPDTELFVQEFDQILRDESIQLVAEAMGGLHPAYDYIKACLEAGKSVVTANKELVAEKGAELLAIAARQGGNLLFEASVAGGIPILHTLTNCLWANRITRIAGILNGTTNFILTKMFREGMSFDRALGIAQEKGYAESDPTADVEGIDACRKICILSDLAWGREVSPDLVSAEGISSIHLHDVSIAAAAGYRIKLLGRAFRLDDGRQCAYVAPHLVPESCPLAMVDDVFNAIMVRGNAVGDVMFYGRGAGALPTASAVLSDVMDAVRSRDKRRSLGWSQSAQLLDAAEVEARWYLRGSFSPADAAAVLDGPESIGEGAVITAPMNFANAKEAAEKLGAVAMLRVL